MYLALYLTVTVCVPSFVALYPLTMSEVKTVFVIFPDFHVKSSFPPFKSSASPYLYDVLRGFTNVEFEI